MNIIKKLRGFFKKEYVLSVYIYGSYVRTENFNDIDLLIIIKDGLENKKRLLEDVKEIKQAFSISLDFNYITEKEFINEIHVDRPKTYFIGIRKENIHLLGKDYLSEVDEKISKELLKRRVASLAQRARHSFLNNKDTDFWEMKLQKWTKTLILECLYYEGVFELDYSLGIKKFISHAKQERSYLKELLDKKISLKSMWLLLERLEDDIDDIGK
jgi:predicted nucleotidyltransferase